MKDKLELPAWMIILSDICDHPETTITQIHKRLDLTYSHCFILCRLLEQKMLVERQKTGRNIFCETTHLGDDLARAVRTIMNARVADIRQRS